MDKRAVGIVIKEGKILLIRRFRGERDGWTKGWYYVFPGGGVEEGETAEEGCVREMKEELSLNVKIEKLLFVMHNPAKVHNFCGRDEYFYLITDFSGKVELGGPEKERMNENDQYHLDWISISEMKNMNTLYPEKAKDKIIDILQETKN
jgi:ADP-ribose pyrophosphatase YjhB (NUDIX family)